MSQHVNGYFDINVITIVVIVTVMRLVHILIVAEIAMVAAAVSDDDDAGFTDNGDNVVGTVVCRTCE